MLNDTTSVSCSDTQQQILTLLLLPLLYSHLSSKHFASTTFARANRGNLHVTIIIIIPPFL